MSKQKQELITLTASITYFLTLGGFMLCLADTISSTQGLWGLIYIAIGLVIFRVSVGVDKKGLDKPPSRW
jgi:arginine exporter protein ArgO